MAVKITKREFDKTYKQHPPNKWVKFVFKYFSREAEKKDMTLSNTLVLIMASFFFVAFIGTVFNAPQTIVKWSAILFSCILVLIAAIITSGVVLNNWRLRKIRKELGISKVEYNKLANKFYP